MKINDINEAGGLPPHLAKFFDKEGNLNPDAQERVNAGNAKRTKGKFKDVTPAGYGPDDIEEAIVEDEADKSSAKYLMKVKRNKDRAEKYFIFTYPDSPGNNPIYMAKLIRENPVLQRLRSEEGFDSPTSTVGIWRGDLDTELNDAKEQLGSGKKWIRSHQLELEKKVKDLTIVKKIIDSGKVIEEGLIEDDIEEAAYKPGITVLTRAISFNDFEEFSGDEDYATIKKIRWPYGIDVKFNDANREVTFKTAKMKTVARILNKHVDFGAVSAGEILDLPAALLMASDTNLPSAKKVGDRINTRNIRTKRNRTERIIAVSKDAHGHNQYELSSGRIVYDQDINEDQGVKYGVFSKGGSIGSDPEHLRKPVKVFDTPEEAKEYAKRMRKLLSPGERKYYGLGYVTKKIKAK